MGSLILVLLLLVATQRLVVAYDFKTHRRISTEAATLSVLSSSCSPAPCRTPLMNLTKTLGGPGAQLPTDIGRTLADAAVAEDDDKRPANHFVNPLTGPTPFPAARSGTRVVARLCNEACRAEHGYSYDDRTHSSTGMTSATNASSSPAARASRSY